MCRSFAPRSTRNATVHLTWQFEAPRLPDRLLVRERLLAHMDRALGKHCSTGDVFLVSAPAGYGKTTTIAQWAGRAGMPVVWYHLGAGDSDPVTFLGGVVHALRGHSARATWEVERMLRRVRGGTLSPLDARRATDLLIADIARVIRRPVTLVLTNTSDLNARGGAHDVLNGLLVRPPDHLRLVLETREAPRVNIWPVVAQLRLDGLGAEELRVRDDELAALLDLLDISLDAEQRETVRALCDGWITGILLSTGALLPECMAQYASLDVRRGAVFDYLASEVIASLPASTSEFATQAAVLSYMTPALCAELLDRDDAREQLGALEKRTGFVTRVGLRPQVAVYRFQPLLRQALLERLESDEDGPARCHALRVRAASVLEERGDYDDAIEQYMEAADYEHGVALIESRRGALLRAGRGDTLARWLDRLPADVRESHPHLLVLLAEIHHQAGRYAEAQETAERACRVCLPLVGHEPVLAAQALLMRATARWAQGHYADARSDCEEAMQCAPRDADEVHIEARFLLTVIVNALDGAEVAEACLQGVAERAERRRDLWAVARLHYLHSKLCIDRGRYSEAESESEAALLAAQEAGDDVDAINSRLNLGTIKHLTDRPISAREDFEAAHTQAEMCSYALGRAYAQANLGDLALAQGEYAVAITAFERALALANTVSEMHLRACVHAGLICALALGGQPQRAIAMLGPLLNQYRGDACLSEWVVLAVPGALAFHRAGEHARAEELLAAASICAQAHGMYASYAHAQLYLAAVRLACEAVPDGLELLRTALDAAARADGASVLQTQVRQLPELWPYIEQIDHPLARALSAKLCAKPSGADEAPAVVTRQATPALRVFALGDSRVFVNTERVMHWRLADARELFYFLLEQQEPVHKETIVAALWPDKSMADSDAYLRQVRFQLNKALGVTCVEKQDGRWGVTMDCWVDTREFERLVDEGMHLASQGNLSAAAVMLRQALTYWSGPYLSDMYSDWVITRRNELQRRYQLCLECLADVEFQLGRHMAASQLYYHLLDIAPYVERAHRGLMACFVALGEPARAIEQFKRCARILEEDLGIAPGPQTMALVQSILATIEAGMRGFAQAHG